jgi:hypothetical protein
MNRARLQHMRNLLIKAAVKADGRAVPEWKFDGTEVKSAKDIALTMGIPLVEAKERLLDINRNTVPGWEGSVGPFPSQYSSLHRYARDIHSGAGNCVCGRAEESTIHVDAQKDVYAGSGAGVTTRGVGTRTVRAGVYQRANALAYGHRRRRRRKKEKAQ